MQQTRRLPITGWIFNNMVRHSERSRSTFGKSYTFLQSSGWQGLEGFQIGQNIELAEGEDEEGGW